MITSDIRLNISNLCEREIERLSDALLHIAEVGQESPFRYAMGNGVYFPPDGPNAADELRAAARKRSYRFYCSPLSHSELTRRKTSGEQLGEKVVPAYSREGKNHFFEIFRQESFAIDGLFPPPPPPAMKAPRAKVGAEEKIRVAQHNGGLVHDVDAWVRLLKTLIEAAFPGYTESKRFSSKGCKRYLREIKSGLWFGLEFDISIVRTQLKRGQESEISPKIVLCDNDFEASSDPVNWLEATESAAITMWSFAEIISPFRLSPTLRPSEGERGLQLLSFEFWLAARIGEPVMRILEGAVLSAYGENESRWSESVKDHGAP